MKRHSRQSSRELEKFKVRQRRQEQRGGFTCCNCKQPVSFHRFMGTANRNHCNLCLWSRHVDESKGDRKATCWAGMRPVGLTFKMEKKDRRGEIMLIHVCAGCEKISINRIAADDLDTEILRIFKASTAIAESLKYSILGRGILLALKMDSREIYRQLYGSEKPPHW